MKILFVGGTGIISSASAARALSLGHDVWLLNRGNTQFRAVPKGAKVVHGDVRDAASVRAAIGRETFDVVAEFMAFEPAHIEQDLALFKGRTAQYVFISSASAYQTPPARLPVTEETPLENPFWEYSRKKIACEERLLQAAWNEGFPVTIVRPSHTYDATRFTIYGGWTAVKRIIAGKPVVVPGDGTSIWTVTHTRDFAKGFVGLLGKKEALGEAFHITSDEWLTWNQMTELTAAACGVAPRLVHVPSEIIARFDPSAVGGLLGDKAHTMIFDNSKVKKLAPEFVCEIPYAEGVKETVAWHQENPDGEPESPKINDLMDRLADAMETIRP